MTESDDLLARSRTMPPDPFRRQMLAPTENAFWAFAALSSEDKAAFVTKWNENEAKRAHGSCLTFIPAQENPNA